MKTLRNNIWRAVYAIIIGLVMVAFPDLTLQYLVVIIGVMLLVFGGILLGIYLNARRNGYAKRAPVEGILAIVLGLMLVIAPTFFLNILMAILGILLIFTGIIQISDIIMLRKHNIKLSWIFYVFPILVFGAGIIVVINPFDFIIKPLMIFFGVASLLSGIIDIVNEIAIRSAWKKKNDDSIMIIE